MRVKLFAAAMAGLLATLAGCQTPPTVHIDYTYAPDLPISPTARAVQVGPFDIDGAPGTTAHFASARLAELLGEVQPYDPVWHVLAEPGAARAVPATLPGEPDLIIRGQAVVSASDTRGTRTIRLWQEQDNRLDEVEVDSLVRKVDVKMDFTVLDGVTGDELAVVATHAHYNSLNDPAVRGPSGAARGDDPQAVPATEDIIKGCLDTCIETFVGMTRPRRHRADVQMRPTDDPRGRQGLQAVRKGHFEEALWQFAQACESCDEADTLFNMALINEMLGARTQRRELLEVSLRHYQRVLDLTSRRDGEAAQAVLRVRRALDHARQ